MVLRRRAPALLMTSLAAVMPWRATTAWSLSLGRRLAVAAPRRPPPRPRAVVAVVAPCARPFFAPATSRRASTARLASTAAPAVEVSPADHGTTPLDRFDAAPGSGPVLDGRLVDRLRADGLAVPTAVQAHALPLLLGRAGDVMASSATGSGKTLMFTLPLLQKLLQSAGAGAARAPRAKPNTGAPSGLVIAPTREVRRGSPGARAADAVADLTSCMSFVSPAGGADGGRDGLLREGRTHQRLLG